MSESRGRGRFRGRGRGRGHGRGSQQSGGRGSPQKFSNNNVSSNSWDQEMNQDLPERFRNGKNKNYQCGSRNRPSSDQTDLDLSVNLQIREYVKAQDSLSSSNDKEKWIDYSEIPKSAEIHLATDANVDLVPNKKDGRFKSIRSYLKTHYSLLREDAVGPLRDAIDKFRNDPDMEDDADVSIYEKVHIRGFTFTNLGIAARLKFSTKRAGRRIMWSASKRLISGSLVALTPAVDNFSTQCIVAIIAARPLDLLERSPPEVDIYFSSPDDIRIDPQVGYIMLEAKQGYFEAYRHTLRALQKMSRESFSLAPNILGFDTVIRPPEYLEVKKTQSLLAVIETDGKESERFDSVDIINDWPATPEATILDQSQWNALEQILTKKLAIIQGPPGTGKTFVSKVALEIMVQNHTDDDPPIIIAAQTNHALDQLLKHVSYFEPEFIRLGGRSTSSEIKKRALYEVRQKERIPQIQGSLFGPARKKLERQQALYGEILSIFDEKVDLITCEELCKLGVINAAQEKSLVDAAKNWVTTDGSNKGPMHHWLHKALLPFEVEYEDDTFGFEDAEEDLEIEQLRETEAEHGLTDEEDIEMLKGPFKAISDNWIVATPSDGDLEKAKKLLDTKQDLWDIPEYLRGPVYSVMKQRAKDIKLHQFREQAQEYDKITLELKIGKWEKDAVFLKRANIIGTTTTGLSKYRPLIASLNPKIILIEEAAEVIEGPVAAAAIESVEHLILVGDHQQLQGHCALRELEGDPFYLNVSMFERLVHLGMPFKTLSRQRRMSTEIRQLVSSLYPNLEDHESILARGPLPQWGTGSIRSFFFHHEWSELKDESLSTYNEEEARMVAKFYRHLLRHDVPAAGITILTFYNGQRKRILRELKIDAETNRTYNNVKTVDSYQGEENEIIILSLVRSNDHGQIGFLEVANRVCVALSRARHGLYLFGNGYLLSERSELWSDVGRLMSATQPLRFGTELPLTCRNHNRTLMARYPEDFDKYDGGCDMWCNSLLPCGHTCMKKCHPMSHDRLQCHVQCGKLLACGDVCKKSCHEICFCNCNDYQTALGASYGQSTKPHYENKALLSGSAHELLDQGSTNMSGRSTPDAFETRVDVQRGKRQTPAGRALARGGAAFQPLLSPLRANTRSSPHRLAEDRTSANTSAQIRGSHNWTSFASGGVKEDDETREKEQATKREAQSKNLIDLSPSNHTYGTVEHSKEKNARGDRRKYIQTFRPAAPNAFECSDLQQLDSSPKSQNKSKVGSGQVQNLMD